MSVYGHIKTKMKELFYSIGTIIIDDIRLPDGTEQMSILGGGLTHGAMGMRIWSENVGLVSGIGEDFKGSYLDEIRTYFNVERLKITPNLPTPRAWQVFDQDGTRVEIFQTRFEDMNDFIPSPEVLLEETSKISGVHLYCPPSDVPRWSTILRNRDCDVILWEPWDGFCLEEHQPQFKEYCSMVDIVSPNLREGRLLTGLKEPDEVVLQLKQYGSRMAVLRMAEKGSLIADEKGNIISVPAYPVGEIVDVTGAGNAYCGGFVVGYFRTGDVEKAGWYGGVSASFALQQFGALYSMDGIAKDVESRLTWYQKKF